MASAEKTAVTIDPAQHGLKQHEMTTSTVVFMIFCLCAAGAYGIEEMIPQAGPGLTLAMLIVVVDVMLFMSAYALIFISACILRIREGDLPRPFRIPLGTKAFIAMCVPSLIIIFVAFFINGTDYFVGGVAALATGPIMYFILSKGSLASSSIAYGG